MEQRAQKTIGGGEFQAGAEAETAEVISRPGPATRPTIPGHPWRKAVPEEMK